MGKNYSTKTYEPIACKLCGKIFTPTHWNTIFCDPVCQQKYQMQKYRERHQSKPVKKICKNCGNEFYTTKSHAVYCSEK